jgi:hypothetical protein
MVQAAFTGFCPAAMIFKKLGLKEGNAFRRQASGLANPNACVFLNLCDRFNLSLS